MKKFLFLLMVVLSISAAASERVSYRSYDHGGGLIESSDKPASRSYDHGGGLIDPESFELI